MKLHTYYMSSAAFRVRIALNLKGIAWDPVVVDLPRGAHREPGYERAHPQALIPSLETGDATLNQSLAIMEYLDETQPGPALLPKDPLGRARVRSLALLVACEIHPLNNMRVLRHLKRVYGFDDEGINTWYGHWIADGLTKLEADLVASAETGRHCYRDEPGMADCCLVPQIFNAKRYRCELAPYPRVMRIFDACMALDAFQRAQPSAQPEAVTR